MPNDNLEFIIDLDSLSERIETQRAACEEFFQSRRKRLRAIEHGLFENLGKISQQYEEWADFRVETEEQDSGLKGERQQLETDRADMEARVLEVEERTLDAQQQLKSQEEKAGELQEQVAALRQQLDTAEEQEQELSAKAAESLRLANERGQRLKALQQQLQEKGAGTVDPEDLARIQAERDKLAATVRRLKKNLDQQESPASGEELESLRLEIEQLKSSNESLQKQITTQGVQGELAVELDADVSDWERRKQELLLHLSDGEGELDDDQRARVDAAIQLTDRIVAARDAKVADLQAKLEQLVDVMEQKEQAKQQSVCDDDRVQAEQGRLQELQKEWEEKVRHAEVDISVRSAEVARKQRELEEKTRDVEAQLALAKKQVALHARQGNKKKKGWLGR